MLDDYSKLLIDAILSKEQKFSLQLNKKDWALLRPFVPVKKLLDFYRSGENETIIDFNSLPKSTKHYFKSTSIILLAEDKIIIPEIKKPEGEKVYLTQLIIDLGNTGEKKLYLDIDLRDEKYFNFFDKYLCRYYQIECFETEKYNKIPMDRIDIAKAILDLLPLIREEKIKYFPLKECPICYESSTNYRSCQICVDTNVCNDCYYKMNKKECPVCRSKRIN